MSSAESNFATLLKRGNGATPETFTTVAEMVSIDPPEIGHILAQATNHDSAGFREYKGTGLKELPAFTATINYLPANVTQTQLYSDALAGDAHNFQICFPDAGTTTFAGAAIVQKFKPMGADAQNPGVLAAQVTFQPTGAWTIA